MPLALIRPSPPKSSPPSRERIRVQKPSMSRRGTQRQHMKYVSSTSSPFLLTFTPLCSIMRKHFLRHSASLSCRFTPALLSKYATFMKKRFALRSTRLHLPQLLLLLPPLPPPLRLLLRLPRPRSSSLPNKSLFFIPLSSNTSFFELLYL